MFKDGAVRILSSSIAVVLVTALGAGSACAASLPTVAISSFDDRGLTPWWGSGFDPGSVLADLLSDRLVNRGGVRVIDREHLKEVLAEQNLSKAGDVTPDTAAELGRMLGVGYLFVGRIVSFTNASNGSGGIKLPFGVPLSSSKTTLHASLKVIEVNSGAIVAALDEEQSTSATSFSVSGDAPFDYKSPDFQNSAVGKLFDNAADDLAAKFDPGKLVATAPLPTVHGKILASDDGSFVLNIGSNGGVQTGMMFKTLDVKRLVDPDTGKTIVSEIPKGTIQIISVSADSSIAKSVNGSVRIGQSVRSE